MRVHERLIEVERAELTARVWLAVEDITKWDQARDVAAAHAISAVLFVHSRKSDPFVVANQLEDVLRKANFQPNAIQVMEVTNRSFYKTSTLVYPEWP